MAKRLSDKERREDLDTQRNSKKWDGVERRKAIHSFVEPYHERRQTPNERKQTNV